MSEGPYRVLVAPEVPPHIAGAVRSGGGTVVGPGQGAQGLIWLSGPERLPQVLTSERELRWCQLPVAGVEKFFAEGVIGADLRPDLAWACAKGSYAKPVAEHALALTLALLRALPERAKARTWGKQAGETLFGARVTLVGGGGITTELLHLLEPFGVSTTVVRRRAQGSAVPPLPGSPRVVGTDQLAHALQGARVVVLALSLTPESEGLIGSEELSAMGPEAFLVNVARGRHVVTPALVDALTAGRIAGAALDVTDPEPLPDGHPLWSLGNCLITPHSADTAEMVAPLLAERARENTARARQGLALLGAVDPAAGY